VAAGKVAQEVALCKAGVTPGERALRVWPRTRPAPVSLQRRLKNCRDAQSAQDKVCKHLRDPIAVSGSRDSAFCKTDRA
jgi:hypothetical protein